MNNSQQPGHLLRPVIRRLLGSTGVAIALTATQAQAQCIGGGSQSQPATIALTPNAASAPRLANGSNFTIFSDPGTTSSSIGSTVQSITSIINTNNTAFLSQTAAFIGAPSGPAAGLNGGGVWARGTAGTFDTRTQGNFSFANAQAAGAGNCNIRNFQDYSGVQVGTDIARLNVDGGNAHFGVMMGYTVTDNASPTGVGRLAGHFETPFFGAYGAYTKDSFYADGQLRFDFLQGRLTDPIGNGLFRQTIDARSVSFTGNVGKQFAVGDDWFVEPSAGGVYTRAHVDRFDLAGSYVFQNGLSAPSSVKIEGFDSILGRLSLRAGRNYVVDGFVIQPFLTGSVFNEFGGRVRTSIVSGFDPFGQVFLQTVPGNLSGLDTRIRVNSGRVGTYGQVSGGVAAQFGDSGWLAYVRGDYRFGDHVEGWGVSGGLRYQFTPERVLASTIVRKGYDVLPAQVGVIAPTSWTGISVGGTVGGLVDVARQVPEFNRVSLFDNLPVRPRAAGILAGGQIGADYQIGSFVVGAAGDLDWTNASGGRNCKTPIGYFFSCNTSVRTLYTATGRLGYAIDRTLFYVKGGYAWADLTESYRDNTVGQPLIPQFTSGAGSFAQYPNANNTSKGWTIGGGFEYALSNNWSAKAEYMHHELDRKEVSFAPSLGSGVIPEKARHSGDLVRIGVNYRFRIEPAAAPAVPVAIASKY